MDLADVRTRNRGVNEMMTDMKPIRLPPHVAKRQAGGALQPSGWLSIDSAPRDGSPVLVNDTASGSGWTVAAWRSRPEWSGWYYADDLLQDNCPTGPDPTHFLPLPPVETWLPIESAPMDGSVVLVNDTTGTGVFALAKWLAHPEWAGWVYDDEVLCDCSPLGPCPSAFFPVSLPPIDARQTLAAE